MSNLESTPTQNDYFRIYDLRKLTHLLLNHGQQRFQKPVDTSHLASVDLTSPLAQKYLVRSGSDPAAIQAFLRLNLV